MNLQDLKIKSLELASSNPNQSPRDIVVRAENYYQWLIKDLIESKGQLINEYKTTTDKQSN
jgi:hypothetical protein